MLITQETKQKRGPEVKIKCPNCHKVAAASTCSFQESIGFFYIQMVTTARETRVECSKCRAILTTKVPLSELKNYSPQELSEELSLRNVFIAKVAAIASLLLFFMPFLGTMLAVVALIKSYRTSGWVRTVSIISLVLSLLMNIGLLTYIIMTNGGAAPR